MFDLEKTISAWRDGLFSVGLSAADVDELESHLRDDFAWQLHSGLDAGHAFDDAIGRLGCPAALQKEFKKIVVMGPFATRAKNAVLSFAGIPNHHLFMNDPSLKLDSRWATYLRSILFLLPALALWVLASTYVTPQFHAIWIKSAGNSPALLDQLLRLDLAIMYLIKDRFLYIATAILLSLALLEWRSHLWPCYRRAVIGSGVFILNLAIVFSFAVMFLCATFAAQQLLITAKVN
jgi:hypothetical protein